MAAPRLPFLYPHLFRVPARAASVLSPRPTGSASPRRGRSGVTPCNTASFQTAPQRSQQAFAPRHGTGVQPQIQPQPQSEPQPTASVETSTEVHGKDKDADQVQSRDGSSAGGKRVKGAPKAEEKKHSGARKRDVGEQKCLVAPPANASSSSPSSLSSAASTPSSSSANPPGDNPGPLDTVLHMNAPSSLASETHKPPHLHAPPYVHHFDTYTLVRDLERGGFTQDQSVTAMKAVRGLLALNLDVAKEELVSKSDVENETYLFRAACSELRTEVQNNRKAASVEMRTERTQLQNEVDILAQRTTQETLSLKDELKGMFDDRRMSVRMEQRTMDSAIQELNYKITVSLNSDMKSEVEGLRWVLTRRAALAIATMAFLILGSLRYTSYQIHLLDLAKEQGKGSGNLAARGGGVGTVPLGGEGGGGGSSVAKDKEGAGQDYESESLG